MDLTLTTALVGRETQPHCNLKPINNPNLAPSADALHCVREHIAIPCPRDRRKTKHQTQSRHGFNSTPRSSYPEKEHPIDHSYTSNSLFSEANSELYNKIIGM